jgi:phage pi2 protein 07
MKQLTEKTFNVSDVQDLLGNTTENIKSNITVKMLQLLPYSGEARTWWFGSEIVGCGGIVIYEDKKCEAWSIINKALAKRLKRELLVGSKLFLDEMAEKYRIAYMRATWRVDFDSGIRWLEHLGFTKENGVEMINDTDKAYIYSRHFKWV